MHFLVSLYIDEHSPLEWFYIHKADGVPSHIEWFYIHKADGVHRHIEWFYTHKADGVQRHIEWFYVHKAELFIGTLSGSTLIKLTVYIGTLSGFTHIRLTVRSVGVSQMQSLPPNVAGGVVYQPGAPPSYPGTFSPAGSVEGSPMHNVYMGQPGQNPPGQYQAMPPAGEDADPPRASGTVAMAPPPVHM